MKPNRFRASELVCLCSTTALLPHILFFKRRPCPSSLVSKQRDTFIGHSKVTSRLIQSATSPPTCIHRRQSAYLQAPCRNKSEGSCNQKGRHRSHTFLFLSGLFAPPAWTPTTRRAVSFQNYDPHSSVPRTVRSRRNKKEGPVVGLLVQFLHNIDRLDCPNGRLHQQQNK